MEGAAVWLSSAKSEITFWRATRAGGIALQKHLGKDIMKRLMSFSTFVDTLHKKHAPSPHYYLFFIGVDPVSQKKGFTSKLLRPMLAWLDRWKQPCYLNTQNQKNIGLYEHFGFRVIDEIKVPETSIIHTAMQRKPQ